MNSPGRNHSPHKRRAHPNLDLEIASAEVRIEYHRRQLHRRMDTVRQAARFRVASPAVLLTAVGAGFLLGALSKRGPRSGRASAGGGLWRTLTAGLTTALKFARTGPVVWLASTIGASRARKQQPTYVERPPIYVARPPERPPQPSV